MPMTIPIRLFQIREAADAQADAPRVVLSLKSSDVADQLTRQLEAARRAGALGPDHDGLHFFAAPFDTDLTLPDGQVPTDAVKAGYQLRAVVVASGVVAADQVLATVAGGVTEDTAPPPSS